MKVSLNLVREFTETKLRDEKLIEAIGAQLGAVDEVIDWSERYAGIVAVRVVSCEKHPDADKLSLCLIDDGGVVKSVKRNGDGLVQVVCGAPNARAGMTAAWLSPGAWLPATFENEPLRIESRKIRGQMSHGMLGSGAELLINADHSGIVELSDDTRPGTPLSAVFELDDTIVDIENKMFTHRPDCFGLLGVAREIAGIQHLPFVSPDWYLKADRAPAAEQNLPLEIQNEAPALVPRFMALAMSGISVLSSPLKLQSYLTRVGIRPINGIVDATNYMMYLTGQPLHAYDYDKVVAKCKGKGAVLVARTARAGEKITVLGGKQVELAEGTVVIATDKEPVGIAGVIGGANTEVDESTQRIILECATFNMYAVRRASMAHGLFTDAAARFTKGQSPLQNQPVLLKTAEMLAELAGAEPAGPVIDRKARLNRPSVVRVHPDFVNERLGLSLHASDMARLLRNVEFAVEIDGELSVHPPFWRRDISIAEDIVEEIGRLYGYDHLPLTLPRRDLKPAALDPMLELKDALRQSLSRLGANEVLTYSFVHGDLMRRAGQDPRHAYEIAKALSPDLQYYRTSLTPSLLDKVHPNIKAGYDQFALFEIGKAHVKGHMEEQESNLPKEEERLALVFAAGDKALQTKTHGAPYFWARLYAEQLLRSLNIKDFKITPFDHQPHRTESLEAVVPFEVSRAGFVRVSDEWVGVVGEYTATVKQNFKLPAFTAGFELDPRRLMKYARPGQNYQPLPDFPKVTQDTTLKTAADMPSAEILKFVKHELSKLLEDGEFRWDLDVVDIYQPEKDKAHKNTTLRLNVASYERTLTDHEVNGILDQVATAAKKHLKAERV
jgi:phenylalanyl-tRNA synthetase beta chain